MKFIALKNFYSFSLEKYFKIGDSITGYSKENSDILIKSGHIKAVSKAKAKPKPKSSKN